jgi:hypothetical protein
MAPKQRVVVHASSRQQRGLISTAWNEITSPDNATVVRSVVIFGVSCLYYIHYYASNSIIEDEQINVNPIA